MTPNDRKAFLEVVIGLAELRGRTLSAPALELYWRAMQDWPLDEFRQAAAHLVKSSQFFPTPADFERLRKAGRVTAGEAWIAAVDIAAKGLYRSGRTVGGITDRAVAAIGGYQAIGMCDESKLHFLERRFAEHFNAIQDADDTRTALPQITGTAALPPAVAALVEKLGSAS